MEANLYSNARIPELPKPPKAQARKSRSVWLVVGLILLSAIPLISGGFRLNQLANGATITPENARFFAAPLPVVLHIVSVSFYAILGAFQFVPNLRQRRNRWHRIAGWFLIPCGLIVALSGLWMTLFYPWPKGDGVIVYGERLLFGSGMLLAILLGIAAIGRRDFTRHGHWMLRGYAIGMGAGTQVLTGMVAAIFVDPPTERSRAILMGAAWVINLALAEWIIRRLTSRSARVASKHARTASAGISDLQ